MTNATSENNSIQVALRIRPITAEDMVKLPTRFQKNILSTSQFAPNQVTVLSDKKQSFRFDQIFGQDASQKDIYDVSVKNMVDKFLEGYNVTILAYGQTSSGKTHTMGTADNSNKSPESKGIIPRSISTLFSYINSSQYKNRKCTIKVSFVELYNEDLIDLLSDEDDEENKPQLTIREDSKGNIICSGLQEIKVTGVDEIMGHLNRGSLNRQVSITDMNSKSSRSHAIFSITLSQQKLISSSSSSSDSPLPTSPSSSNPSSPRVGSRTSFIKNNDKGEWISITSKFHFVDLAGSERLKRTSSIGDRVKEGISINSGLLALGNVISALGDPLRAKNITHIPYRDSKLTRLLQDSLGGNSQTLMIACVTPAEFNINETTNTLKYANRARNIKNVATINQEESGWQDLEHLQNLVLKLRNEIKALKQSVGIISSNTPGSGRNTPTLQPDGRDTPLDRGSGIGAGGTGSRRPSTPITTSINNGFQKDIETLEEQLSELQRSYVELSQKHAKTTAELSAYQDNFENFSHNANGLASIKEEENVNYNNNDSVNKNFSPTSFQETIKPVIEEYEKSIAELESKLGLTRTALATIENQVQEYEMKLIEVEDISYKDKNMIMDLKNQIFKHHEREETNENYIKDLEAKIDSHDSEQEKDQKTIDELKERVSQLKSTAEISESFIQKLEAKLARTEQKYSSANDSVLRLEKRLQESGEAYVSLEEKYNKEKSYNEEDANLLLAEVEDRDARIAHLEKKVDELVNEISQLKFLKTKTNKHDFSSSSPLLSPSSSSSSLSSSQSSYLGTPLSRSSSLNTSISTSDCSELESKLCKLQKTHVNTVLEFKEIKDKYQSCLEEINELYAQLADAKASQSNTIEITPSTPLTDSSFDSQNDSDSLSPCLHGTHRKTRSLSTEIKGTEKKELNSMAMIQKLQIEFKQLELLHDDKAKGLEAVRQEFARLETNHLTTIEIVEELREEIKRRDALAQLEVMSVMTSENGCTDGGFSAAASEVDQADIVHRLREEVDQLKEEQKKTLDLLSKSDTKEIKNDKIFKIESSILQLKSEMIELTEEHDQKSTTPLDKINDETINKLQSKMKEYEEQLLQAQEAQRQIQVNEAISNLEEINDTTSEPEQTSKIIELHQQVKKIQNEIEAKSHTIAALLFPSIENQNTIRRLEDELQESREVLRLAIEEKDDRLEGDDIDNEFEIGDKHIKELEDSVKDLEIQLNKAKEAQHVPTRRGSIADDVNQTYVTIEVLVEKLNELQHESKNKKHTSADHLDKETELFANLHKQIETIKSDVNQKCELIKMLKRDLADKSTLQQRLKEKEADALTFRAKLMEVHKNEEALKTEIKELKTRLHQLENGEDVNKVLYNELETLRKEFKEVCDREVIALERLRVLKTRIGADNEELHLQEQLEHLRYIEIAQRERILVLEGRLTEQGGKVDEDLVRLRTEVALAKESESTHKKKIENLEVKLKKAEDKSQIALLKREINTTKDKEIEQSSKTQELELKLSQQITKDGQQVKQLNEKIEKLHATEIEQRKQIETLEIRLELVQDEDPDISLLRDQIASLRASEADLKRNIQELESKLLSSQKEYNIFETVKEEVKLLKEVETGQKSTIEQLQSQLRKIRNGKESAVKELQTMKGGFSLQKELVISQEEELKILRKELAMTKEKSKTSLEEFGNLSRLLSEAEKRCDESQKRVKTLEIEIETYKIAGSGSDDDVKALCRELSNTKLEMISQNEIIVELDSQLIEIEKERDQNLKQVVELKKTLEEKEASQKDAIGSLENTLVNLESELDKFKYSSNVNNDIVVNIEGNLSVVKEQLQYAKDLDEKRYKMINGLESKLIVVIDTLTEKENHFVDQDSMISELEKIILAMQVELSSTSSEIEESPRIKQLETKINELTFKLANDTEIESIKSELARSKTNEAKQNQNIKELEISLKKTQNLCTEKISKFKSANKEINELQEKCTGLQNKLEDALHGSLIKSYENIDDSMIEDLTDQLKKTHLRVVENREHVTILEKSTKQLELEKSEQIERNENLEQHSEQLQKDIETLAEEFAETVSKLSDADELSKQQKDRVFELEMALEEAKGKSSTMSNSASAKLESVNELLGQNNENLNLKIVEAEDQIQTLNEKIKLLENEVIINSETNVSIIELREQIMELQSEKEVLEEANENHREEHSRLDLKVESLLEQFRSIGLGGNKAAVQIAQLNEELIVLEKKLTVLKRDSSVESKEMIKEITRLLEINEQLEQKIKDLDSSLSNSCNSISSVNSLETKNKLIKQEVTIAHQNNIIKTLKEKITELEPNDYFHIRMSTASISSISSEFKKNTRLASGNYTMPPPPVPPPNHPPPPPPPSNFNSPPSTPGLPINLPPRASLSVKYDLGQSRSRRGSDVNTTTTAGELVSEIQKLHKKIVKLESESSENKQLVESLETTLKEEETELRVAKEQLTILQRERNNYMSEIKTLRAELDEAQIQVELTKNTVQEEKKVMETVLEEERKAKEKAERARLNLESQMEQLMAKKNKFMCF